MIRSGKTNIKKISLVSFIIFLLWMAYLFIRFYGEYAYDEMYHISSSDQYFHTISEYHRAPYLNWAIYFLTILFGRNYYTYKLIPFILSLISIGILLYLLSKLARHSYSIILFLLLVSTHCLLVFNHLYIRMYICDEAVISILALLLYKLALADSVRKRILLNILYIMVASFLFLFHPSEQSSISVLAVGIAAWIASYIGPFLLSLLQKKGKLLFSFLLSSFLLIGLEIIIVLIRTGEVVIPGGLRRITLLPTSPPGTPVFTLYFLTQNILLTLGLIGLGYFIVKNIKINRETIIGIYALGFVPFLAYNMLFFDCGPFRSFNSYLPILIFISILWIDSLPQSILYRSFATVAVIATVIFSSPDRKFISFYESPYIFQETYFNNYGGLIDQAKQEINNGRKCISIWANEHQQAAFELNCEYSIAIENSANCSNGYSADDLQNLLTYIAETDQQYALIIGIHTNWRLDTICPGFMEYLYQRYPYIKYGQEDAFIFYIN